MIEACDVDRDSRWKNYGREEESKRIELNYGMIFIGNLEQYGIDRYGLQHINRHLIVFCVINKVKSFLSFSFFFLKKIK